MCLIMGDIEALKPTNTGWLIADVVRDTFAFGWARTSVEPGLLALLADPQWDPYVVFPEEFVEAKRVVTTVQSLADKRPLFILLDGTWAEACKMCRKSPYLDHLPVLSMHPEQQSRYRLRRSKRDDHLCTSEVGALCLALAGEQRAADTLEAYLDVFTNHYLNAKLSVPPDFDDAAHRRLHTLTWTRDFFDPHPLDLPLPRRVQVLRGCLLNPAMGPIVLFPTPILKVSRACPTRVVTCCTHLCRQLSYVLPRLFWSPS
jgi:DTW domain-containing protein YfiP